MNSNHSAMKSVEKSRLIAKKCPYRPEYHFLAPANWMNDPNGPIYYKGEYHLFYQHNPYGEKWGNIHWGHTKSKDLVYWEHLPIALFPSIDKGEAHCFSGCCVDNNGMQSIIYTSIGLKKSPKTKAEQWLAISNDDMETWEKYSDNPIMTLDLHDDLEVRDWRDPYIWWENNIWYAVLGGHIRKPNRGVVLLYKSQDLINWEFIHPLLVGEKGTGRNWECPIFFRLGEKYILIVSPHKRVIYTIGTYENHKFNHGKWQILDLGYPFYAPNTMLDGDGRRLLWGWIQGGGNGGWNGCLTLPRVLELSPNNELKIKPAPELKKLRKNHINLKNIEITPESSDYLTSIINEMNLEIIAEFEKNNVPSFGLKLIDLSNNNKEKNTFLLYYNNKTKNIISGKEKGNFILEKGERKLKLHIFIDRSVIEVYINYKKCITSRYYPKNFNSIKIDLFSEGGNVKLHSIDVWNLNSI